MLWRRHSCALRHSADASLFTVKSAADERRTISTRQADAAPEETMKIRIYSTGYSPSAVPGCRCRYERLAQRLSVRHQLAENPRNAPAPSGTSPILDYSALAAGRSRSISNGYALEKSRANHLPRRRWTSPTNQPSSRVTQARSPRQCVNAAAFTGVAVQACRTPASPASCIRWTISPSLFSGRREATISLVHQRTPSPTMCMNISAARRQLIGLVTEYTILPLQLNHPHRVQNACSAGSRLCNGQIANRFNRPESRRPTAWTASSIQ